MNKKIFMKSLLMSLVFLVPINCSAKMIKTDDIKKSTYVIGNHMFTRDTSDKYDGDLKTEYIMLASKTILGNDLNDMIIYYKNARGKWLNGLTGEAINIEKQIDIEKINLENVAPTPVLSIVKGDVNQKVPSFTYRDEKYFYDLTIDIKSNYYDGFDIFEKQSNGGYLDTPTATGVVAGTTEISIPMGEAKTYIAKVFLKDAEGNKIYGNSSKELVIDTSKNLDGIELYNPYADKNNGTVGFDIEKNKFTYDLAVKTVNEETTFAGFDVFEKQEDGLYLDTPVAKASMGGAAVVYVNPNSTKTFAAKLYVLDKQGKKVYGKLSNELVISSEEIFKAPEFVISIGDPSEKVPSFAYRDEKYFYDVTAKNMNEIFTGFDVFEKQSNGSYLDTPTATGAVAGATEISIPMGKSKTYIAKGFFKDVKGNKIYSNASKELVIDTSENLDGITLYNPYADKNNGTVGFDEEKGKFTYDLAIKTDIHYTPAQFTFAGWDVFEKLEDGSYSETPVAKATMGGAGVVYVDPNSSKTFAAKLYVLDKQGKKVYGKLSNELVIKALDKVSK